MSDGIERKLENHKKVVATLCYIENEYDEILMLHRNKKENDMHAGKYNGLGGKSEKGEDPYTCIVREVKEEAGITIEPKYFANLTFDNFMPGIDWEVHLFKATGYKGSIQECPEGDLVWVKKDDLLEQNLWEGDKIFLEYLDSDRFFIGRFRYDDGKVSDHQLHFMHYME
ncbi:MAG: NUDIX hydrolase [Candidatus Woesearchaeota archaeon]